MGRLPIVLAGLLSGLIMGAAALAFGAVADSADFDAPSLGHVADLRGDGTARVVCGAGVCLRVPNVGGTRRPRCPAEDTCAIDYGSAHGPGWDIRECVGACDDGAGGVWRSVRVPR